MKIISKNKKFYIGGIVVLLLVCGGTAFAVHKHTDNVEAASEQTTKANSKLATINKKYGNFNKLENNDAKLQTLKGLKAEYSKYSKKDNTDTKVINKYKSYIAEETKYFKTENAKTLKDNNLAEDKIKDTDVTQLQEKSNGLNGYIDTVNKEAKIVYAVKESKKLVKSASDLKAKYDTKMSEVAASSSSEATVAAQAAQAQAESQQAQSAASSSAANSSSSYSSNSNNGSSYYSNSGSSQSYGGGSSSQSSSNGDRQVTAWIDGYGSTTSTTNENNGNLTINGDPALTVN